MADSVSLCLCSYYVLDPLADDAARERDYAETLKPLFACLCADARISFSLYLSGEAIEWIERFHAEFFQIAAELIGKRRLEILGGGFFAPFFPFIPATDRLQQLEMLATAIRKATGKKPRGAWLPASAWDASMVAVLSGCGIEYVFIDAQMIEHSGSPCADGTFPVCIEENGKTITAIPYITIKEINAISDDETLKRFCASLSSKVKDSRDVAEAIFIPPNELKNALLGERPWLVRLFDAAAACSDNLSFFTAGQIAKSGRAAQRWLSLPAGMSPACVRRPPKGWDAPALCKASIKQNVINGSRGAFSLYAKMMHVHTLVNQVRGDKARKSAAREELCRAQNYLLYSREGIEQEAAAAYVYKKLLAAERLTRQRGVFSDSIASFDYDFDGRKEYLSQTEAQNMHLHALGGKIFECAVFSAGRNFCRFLGNAAASSCEEGFFVDCFASQEDMPKMHSFDVKGLPAVFSSNFYQEESVNVSRKEVVLKTAGLYGPFKQSIALKKRFLFTKSGLQIQFILKNDSPMNLSGVFGTALHFALTPHKKKAPTVSLFSCEARQSAPQGVREFPQVEWILISDSDGGPEFNIEANENPSAVMRFSLGQGDGAQEGGPCGNFLNVLLYWQVALSPGYETEKTVFLTIRPEPGVTGIKTF